VIFKDSRYAKVPLYTVTDRSGRQYRALTPRVIPATPARFRHTVVSTDRLDLIAFQYYGKADRFWRICDGNTELQPDALLQPGRQVLIPPDLTA
jgi:hypothetical protein